MRKEDASKLVSELFHTWYPYLFRYAYRATASRELAEDAVQESFMRLFRELRKGKSVRHPKAWTLCVVRHEIGKEVRSHSRRDTSQDAVNILDTLPASIPTASSLASEVDDLKSLFSELTRREEEVVLLRLEALKYREIASQLGISANSVNTLLARALRKLRGAARTAEGVDYEDMEDRVSRTLQ